jgi:hypothetical protein
MEELTTLDLENEKLWRELWIKYLQGSQNAKAYLQKLWPYIATGDEKLYRNVMSRFYRVVGLQEAFEEKAGDKLSPRDLEKVFVVLEKHPFVESKETSKYVVLADLGIIKSEKDIHSERVKKLLEDYEEWKKMEKRRDILNSLGYVFLPITVLDLLLLRNKRLSPKAEMGMGFLGIAQMIVGGLNAIRRLPDTEYHLQELSPAWRLINGLIALRGMARAFKGFKNPAFKWELAKTKVWNLEIVEDNRVAWEVAAIGRVKNLLHAKQSIIEAARRSSPTFSDIFENLNLSEILKRAKLYVQDKINLLKLDIELPGMQYYIGALEEYKERLDLIRGMLNDEKFFPQFLKELETGKFSQKTNDFIEHISQSITLNELAGTELMSPGGRWRILRIIKHPDGSETEQILYKDKSFDEVYNIWKKEHRNIIAEYYFPTQRKTPDGKVEIEERVVKTIPLRDKYIPLFSPSFIVKYEKDGAIYRETYDYFSLKTVIPQIEAEGGKILEVRPPSVRIYETRKFARKIEEEVKQMLNYLQAKGVRIEEEADLDELLKTFHDNLGRYIDEMKKIRYVWGLERQTDLGFLEKLKEKSFAHLTEEEKLELAKEFIFDNIRRRIFPKEVIYYRTLLENLEASGLLGRQGRIMLEVAREIERPTLTLGQISDINRKLQRLMIIAHFPVRVFNTMASLLIPIRRVFENSGLSDIEKWKIATKMVLEIGKSVKDFSFRSSYKTAFQGAGEMSAIDMVNLLFKAPFEHAVESVLERWSKVKVAGKTLLEWGFPEMGGSVHEAKHLIDLIFMGSAAYGRPVFLYTKPGKALNELSAFFAANYLPFYLSARALYRSIVHPKWGSLFGIFTTGFIYATLVGFSNLPFFDILDKVLRFGAMLWNTIERDEKITPPDVNIPFYLLASAFGIPSGVDIKSEILANIMMGGGLLGWATGWRTKAGSLGLPEILNSPLVEIPRRFFENLNELKNKIKTDPKNADIYLKAIFDTFAETGAILTRINNNFFDRFSSFMYEPYHKWRKYLEQEFGGVGSVLGEAVDIARAVGRIMFPYEVFPPAFARIYDRTSVQRMRESGIESLAYMYSSIERGLRRGGNIEQYLANINKQIDSIINKIGKEKWNTEDVKNLIFLQLLRKDFAGKEPALSEREIKKIAEVFHVDEKAIEDYASKLKSQIKLAKAIAKKGKMGELIRRE